MKSEKSLRIGDLKKLQIESVAAARAAGGLMRRNLLAKKKVNRETSHDIKLELDVRCQKLIARKLHAAFPKVALLGEEGSGGAAGARLRWVVDPIDGTVNFAHGIPHASVSIALQERTDRRGEADYENGYLTVLGVVYDPFTEELWTAIRGQPAFLNGKRIHVSRRRRLAPCIFSIGFAKNRSSLELALPYFTWLARRVRKIRMMGSAALGLTYVATGRFDGYVERGVSIWDIAAGGLIVDCAGGRFWHQQTDGQHRHRMIATNGLLHRQLPHPK